MDSAGTDKTVKFARDGNIAILTVDNPPVNAGSPQVKADLTEAVARCLDTAGLTAVVLVGAGGTFIAGADLKEFENRTVPPVLPDLLKRMDAAAIPFICAIDGSALGGGFEVALGCDYRLATATATVGLPEVTLGIVPGAGGTQRLPRLTGMPTAIELIVSGHHVPAPEALRLGMIDRVVEGDLLQAALAFARELPPRRRLLQETVPPAAEAEIAAAEQAVLRKAKRNPAATEAARLVRLSAQTSAEEALAEERAVFTRLRLSNEARALRHLFFAERKSGRISGVSGRSERQIRKVGIIGSGTMGAGIAIAAARAGYDVTVVERDADSARQGTQRIAQIAGEQGPALEVRSDMGLLADVDLIVEAAFEDMGVKKELFARLDAIARPGAIIASNTSYLDVNVLARCTSRPGDVLGLHFFSPAHIMKLIEIVRTDLVTPDTLKAGLGFAKTLGKIPIIAGVCDGFVGNRIFAVYRNQCSFMMEDGTLPDRIDQALQKFGWAMGPFAVSDLVGLDIDWAGRKRRAPTRHPQARYVAVADRLCEEGNFGRKTGKGWYVYDNGKSTGLNPDVPGYLEAERKAKDLPRIDRDDDAIALRALASLVNEACLTIEDGIAQRASDIDVAFTRGYGFPRDRGGPMFAADLIGADKVLADVEQLVAENGVGWRVSNLLRETVAAGKRLADIGAA